MLKGEGGAIEVGSLRAADFQKRVRKPGVKRFQEKKEGFTLHRPKFQNFPSQARNLGVNLRNPNQGCG